MRVRIAADSQGITAGATAVASQQARPRRALSSAATAVQLIKAESAVLKDGFQELLANARVAMSFRPRAATVDAATTRATARYRKDMFIAVPVGVLLMVVPGSVVLFAVIARWQPWLLPSAFSVARARRKLHEELLRAHPSLQKHGVILRRERHDREASFVRSMPTEQQQRLMSLLRVHGSESHDIYGTLIDSCDSIAAQDSLLLNELLSRRGVFEGIRVAVTQPEPAVTRHQAVPTVAEIAATIFVNREPGTQTRVDAVTVAEELSILLTQRGQKMSSAPAAAGSSAEQDIRTMAAYLLVVERHPVAQVLSGGSGTGHIA